MKKIILPALMSMCLAIPAVHAQSISDFKTYKTQASGPLDARHLLETLIGEGVVLKSYSITKTPSDEAYGFFEDRKASLGMKKGLIMTTGGISGLCSGNTSTAMSNITHSKVEGRNTHTELGTPCPDLEKLLEKGQKTFDVCFIEMDVIPTADTLSFNYVFGSEEYDEFVGSNYNDVFAFFISGKGINGEKNLAVVPGTNIPVSVNTINNSGPNNGYNARPSNSSYYVSNMAGQLAIEYDGLTKLMEIRQPVTPYESYHIKLAIADVSDNSYDSGVLIEGQSFVSYERTYNVLYSKNSSDIDQGYKTLLDNLAKVYLANPKGKIIITGHTDNEGSEELNEELSFNRATGVVNYLQGKGIEASRIIMNCKGETQPRYDNNNEKGKILNRRVEIKIGGAIEEYIKKKEEAESVLQIEDSKLLSNYPNPFKDFTTIEAYLKPEVANAQIIVQDLSGKIIKSIYLLERGKTSATFDGQNLANGIYVATLVLDNEVSESIKIVVAH